MVAVAGSGLRPAPWILGRHVYRVVQDYGADPTGTVDSSAKINAALAAAHAAGGGVVFFDSGTYLANIVWPAGGSDITLLGYGVLLYPFNLANDVILIRSAVELDRAAIMGSWHIINAAQTGAPPPPGAGAALHINISANSAASYFENIEIQNGGNGVWVEGTGTQGAAVYMRNLQIFGTAGPGASLRITGNSSNSGNVQIDKAQITNGGTGPGITITGGLGHSFVNVDCEDTADGVQIFPSANPSIQDLFFTNCTIAAGPHTPTTAFAFNIGAIGGRVENLRITGGEATGFASQSGIVINDSGAAGAIRGVVIDGVYIGGNVVGVLINSASGHLSDWHVQNCTMIGNATAGVQIAQPTIDWWIQNNYIAGADGGPASAFGVVTATAGANYGRITGNSVRQNVTTPIGGTFGANVDFGGFNGTPPGTNY